MFRRLILLCTTIVSKVCFNLWPNNEKSWSVSLYTSKLTNKDQILLITDFLLIGFSSTMLVRCCKNSFEKRIEIAALRSISAPKVSTLRSMSELSSLSAPPLPPPTIAETTADPVARTPVSGKASVDPSPVLFFFLRKFIYETFS